MRKQYEEPVIETIVFKEARNVFTVQSTEAGEGPEHGGGGEGQDWAS